MPKQTIVFEIDDSQTADQALTAFAEALKQADLPLAQILASVLSDLSQDIAVDQDQLLDALYAATAPVVAGPGAPAEAGQGQ
ncbi:MAG: hypothetical protein U0987_03865 [Afipia sp.]|nr:hypothetical protein [Afipia sp.]